jgi:glucosylceramidase
MTRPTRRSALKASSAGLAAVTTSLFAQSAAPPDSPTGSVAVRVTSARDRYADKPALSWRPAEASTADSIVVDPKSTYQEILGFGGAFTDSACYMFHQLRQEERDRLMNELFSPSQAGLSVCRLCIGASDYATKAYSYDEGEPDPEMKRFSIEHDTAYILPTLKQAREMNPDLFLLGSPWSPPGWMKSNKSLLGGVMQKKAYAPYAEYFAKFLKAYREAGVVVNAVTVQNEVDTNQDGNMPACQWGQEYEVEFVGKHLGPRLATEGLDTKIWLIDHNYNLWGRAICELDDPLVQKYADGIAWHGYLGEPSAMTRVHEAHPDKNAYWTEGGPAYNAPDYQTDWTTWASTFTGILRNWSRCIIAWNLALDERGKPNIGPFDCGGVLTIDSKTGEVTRSGQFWALSHFSHSVRRGATRIGSTGELPQISHVAFTNPNGQKSLVLTNAGKEQRAYVRLGNSEVEALLPASAITTLTWA